MQDCFIEKYKVHDWVGFIMFLQLFFKNFFEDIYICHWQVGWFVINGWCSEPSEYINIFLCSCLLLLMFVTLCIISSISVIPFCFFIRISVIGKFRSLLINEALRNIVKNILAPRYFQTVDEAIAKDTCALVHPQFAQFGWCVIVLIRTIQNSLEYGRKISHVEIVMEFHSTWKKLRHHMAQHEDRCFNYWVRNLLHCNREICQVMHQNLPIDHFEVFF
mmetsp:Transcript_37432/g.48173  ORF Transcript_37432/g.48173 Transcript_37432/m.48173 type:complete len:219 (+) Transcript_37432:5268-5924(+)